jgi:hypothetical protein
MINLLRRHCRLTSFVTLGYKPSERSLPLLKRQSPVQHRSSSPADRFACLTAANSPQKFVDVPRRMDGPTAWRSLTDEPAWPDRDDVVV